MQGMTTKHCFVCSMFHITEGFEEYEALPVQGFCPDGSAPFHCLADPCKAHNPCNNATEVCQSNYCGGCNTVCIPLVVLNSSSLIMLPSTTPNSTPSAGQCPDGSVEANCLVDPCANNGLCSANQTCWSDPCGDCTATCLNNTVSEANMSSVGNSSSTSMSLSSAQQAVEHVAGQCSEGVTVGPMSK